jgi:hypothetical protein
MDFSRLLAELTVPNNESRLQAEHQYEAIRRGEHAHQLPILLLGSIQDHSQAEHIRTLAGVLLRRLLIDEEEFFSTLAPGNRERLKQELLTALSGEAEPGLKSKICNIVAELSQILLSDGEDGWSELLEFVKNACVASNARDRETGLTLLGQLPVETMREALLSEEALPQVIQLIHLRLLDNGDTLFVSLAALRALTALLKEISQDSMIANFAVLVEPCMTALRNMCLQAAADSKDDNSSRVMICCSFIEALITIAEDSPTLFTEKLELVVESCLAIMEGDVLRADSLNDARHMVMELLVSLATVAPKRCRKMGTRSSKKKGVFATRVFPLCLEMLLTVKDDPNWETAEDAEDETASDSACSSDVGEAAIDRLCCALGLLSTFEAVSMQVSGLTAGVPPTRGAAATAPVASSSGNVPWQYLYAALRVVGCYVEVTTRMPDAAQLAQHRGEIAMLLLQYAPHPHARVRAAAYFAINQFFSFHGSSLQAEVRSALFTACLRGTTRADNPAPRARHAALGALISFCNECPQKELAASSGALLNFVTQALREGPVIVQESAVSVVIDLALKAPKVTIADFYNDIAPILSSLLQEVNGEEQQRLWGLGLECLAAVGECAGPERFRADAYAIMDSLAAIRASRESNPERDYGDGERYQLRAWVRIARCLGRDFAQYSEMVMQQLLTVVDQKTQVPPDELDNDWEDDADVQMVEAEGGWMAVRTSAVEDQASAIQLIFMLAQSMSELFYPFVKETVSRLGELLVSPFEDVRGYSMAVVPEIIRAVAKAGFSQEPCCANANKAELLEITGTAIQWLCDVVREEEELELIMTGLQGLSRLIRSVNVDWQNSAPATGEAAKVATPDEAESKLEPNTSRRLLTLAQMELVTDLCRQLLRESLQRRAVARAESQVGVDPGAPVSEEDALEDAQLAELSKELHFNIAELVGELFKAHGPDYFPIYRAHWHESVLTMGHVLSLKEDRLFAALILAEALEFGVACDDAPRTNPNPNPNPNHPPDEAGKAAVADFLLSSIGGDQQGVNVVSLLLSGVTERGQGTAKLRQACAYTIGVAAGRLPHAFLSAAGAGAARECLSSLSSCIHAGEGPGEPRGTCTDTAASSVGLLLEQLQRLTASGGADSVDLEGVPPLNTLWEQWLSYLPPQHDDEERERVRSQLVRLILEAQNGGAGSGGISLMTCPHRRQRVGVVLDALVTDTDDEMTNLALSAVLV